MREPSNRMYFFDENNNEIASGTPTATNRMAKDKTGQFIPNTHIAVSCCRATIGHPDPTIGKPYGMSPGTVEINRADFEVSGKVRVKYWWPNNDGSNHTEWFELRDDA